MKRTRNKDGKIRKKRSDARMGEIEKQYNTDFGVRSDMKLGTFLKRNGYPSLAKIFSL